jgi:hypothetical protein
MSGREWVEIKSQAGQPTYWVPRDVMEKVGVECSPLDRVPKGTVWIRVDQAKKLRAHREAMTEAEFEASDDRRSDSR